ncbi:hypothetical protein MPER_10272, partial [Moniliophthora perniciosa FA553]
MFNDDEWGNQGKGMVLCPVTRKCRGPIDLTPEWALMWTSAVDIEITSSSSVNSRIRVAFLNRRQGSDFRFLFSLATPTDAKILMRRAFLSQSFAFMEKAGIDFNSSHYCFYCLTSRADLLDHVQFDIKGRFESLPSSSAASSVPIYLFIDPLKTQMINGLPCLEYPPKAPFVHWSLNPDGPGAPVDIHEYGLPQVQLEIWSGTWWGVAQYEA